MGNKHVTNITIKESSIHAVLQFSNSYQRDKEYCNAGRIITTQNNSEPLRTLVLGGFLHKIMKIYK